MKRAIGFLFVIAVCLCVAKADKPLNTDTYFAYPRATIVIESNGAKSVAECSQNHSTPTAQDPEPHFLSGIEDNNGLGAHWEFVRRTRYGDVYLIKVMRPGKAENIFPVLFKGETLKIIATNDLNVTILPEHPK